MHFDPSRRLLLQAGALSLLYPALSQGKTAQGFRAGATAEQVTQGIDLRGKTALVTGCNSGIGRETMRVLSLRGAHVIGTARSLEKGEEACKAMPRKATAEQLDLADFDSVVACGKRVAGLTDRIDILVCNAGIVLDQLEQVRGLEKTFVVNHLGHYLLVRRLLKQVIAAPQGRVVVVGSGDHRSAPPGGIQFQDLSGRTWTQRYGHSKLANGLFSLELARRLAKTRATSNCLTPGHTRTNILRHTGNNYREDARTVEQGAATPCYVATAPTLAKVSGQYFSDFRIGEQSPQQRDKAMAARLWNVSEDLVRDYLPA